MRAFYLKLSVFLLPVFLLWGGLEYFYRSVETNYTFKAKKIVEQYKEAEILVMGNSHNLYGINPTYFSMPAFNLANTSQSLYFDELLLKKHLDSLTKLKVVILNVSYFSLGQEENSSDDLWRKYFYKEQMDLEVPIISKFDVRSYSLALVRRLDKSAMMVHEYFEDGTAVGCYENGYGKQDERDLVSDIPKIAPNIAKKHEFGSDDFSNAEERLNRIIESCKKKGVKVILVQMPVHETYYNLLKRDKWMKIDRSCEQLASKHANAYHLSLRQDERFDERDLRDADHLTNEGAGKMTKLLNNYILELL